MKIQTPSISAVLAPLPHFDLLANCFFFYFPAGLTHSDQVADSSPTVHVLAVSAWVLVSPGAPASSHGDRRLHRRENSRLPVGVIVNWVELGTRAGCSPYSPQDSCWDGLQEAFSDGLDRLITFCVSGLPPLRRDWEVSINAADKSVQLAQVFCSRR